MPTTFLKDLDTVFDYKIDWLDDDTINSSEWTVHDWITNDPDTNTTTLATI